MDRDQGVHGTDADEPNGGTGLGKLYSEPSAAKVTREVLTKQRLDIGLLVSTTRMRLAWFLYGA